VNVVVVITLDPRNAEQFSTGAGGAGQAVDGDTDTASCTQDTAGQPWWAIDLGQVESVAKITITIPNLSGAERKYNLASSTNLLIHYTPSFYSSHI